jgi:hypothetical protein
MKRTCLLFALCSFCCSLAIAAMPARGYIVTKDQKMLTGYIADVYQTTDQSIVVFINDFGTPYFIQAELILGFVYREGEEGEYVTYISLPTQRRSSTFLRIVEQGRFSLFLAPEHHVRASIDQGVIFAQSYQVTEYWLLAAGEAPMRLRRSNYKRKLKRLLRPSAPEMVGQIGREGFKFQDLPAIIRSYNLLFPSKGWTL